MDSVYLYNKYGEAISYDFGMSSAAYGLVCDNWQQPDEGIWEVRGGTAGVCLLARHVLGRDRSRDSPRA